MTEKVERKRQARGEARIKSLLGAAESVFGKVGYHSATTNEISAVAEVSPATLYQFFLNKDALANALMVDYAERITQMHQSMDLNSLAKQELTELINETMTPMLDFHKHHPAFMTLIIEAPLTAETKAVKQKISELFVAKLSEMFRLRKKSLSKGDADWAGETCMIIYKGFLTEIYGASGAKKKRLTETFKTVLVEYLRPIVD